MDNFKHIGEGQLSGWINGYDLLEEGLNTGQGRGGFIQEGRHGWLSRLNKEAELLEKELKDSGGLVHQLISLVKRRNKKLQRKVALSPIFDQKI